jgi:hypothetical protein
MKHLSNYVRCLLLVLLASLASGCADMFDVSERAKSDYQWRQYNPNWQSPTPQDPRPQWSIFGWPRDAQFP